MKKILLIFALLIFSCQTPSKITDEEVMETFNSFFEVLDKDIDNFDTWVTDDFYIFENSRTYSIDEFIEFVKSFDIIDSKRTYQDIKIKTDHNSAHITLRQLGEFRVNTPDGRVKLNFEWLESAYLIKENDSLKFQFYFSEAIKNTTTKIDE